MTRASRLLIAVLVFGLSLAMVSIASGEGGGGSVEPPQVSKKGPKLKAKIKKKAKYDQRQRIQVTVEGTAKQLRGTKVELRVRERKRFHVEDRARVRRGTHQRLKWRPQGLGVTKVQVALARGNQVVAKRSKRVFVVHPVRVLEPSDITSVPPPGTSGPVTYAGSKKLGQGDIIATGIGPATPDGFLGVVDGRSRGTLQTDPTTLLHALPKGSIDVSQTYGAISANSSRARQGSLRVPLRASIECSGGAEVRVEGSASLSPRIEFHADWGFFSLDSARIEGVVRLDAELSASAEARASCTAGPVVLARYPLPKITAFAGPVPVVISPQVVITLEADGSVSARASSSIHGAVEGRAGVKYDDGFSPIGSFTPSFDYSPPALSNEGHLGATLTPALDMLVYGVAGPEIFVDAGLSLDAEVGADPWWTLTAPVRAGARLTVPALHLDSGDLTVYEDRFLLAQADSAPAPPEHRAVITWSTDGSDVDLHIWDTNGNHAWYGDQEGIPDATLSTDITDGFGPEVFSDQRTPADRTVTYGLCYYDDHDTGPTTVTMDITDPDGSIRSSTHPLSGDGDSVLIGTSPPGASGYIPGNDWCGA